MVQDGSTRYITGPGGLPIEQVDGSSNVLYYYQDQLGSMRGLLDGSGNTQATYTFDPYGNVTSKTGSATTPFGYAGQYTDAESGLQNLRARYYDPATVQFITVDPMTALTGGPYVYASTDPLNMTDPSGACASGSGRGPKGGPAGPSFYNGPWSEFPSQACPRKQFGPVRGRLLTNARIIYRIAIEFGLPPNRAREVVAAAYMESTLDSTAKNQQSGAVGLFQLLPPYSTWAKKHGGEKDATANTLAFINRYRKFWTEFPHASTGWGAAHVEASSCPGAFYAQPLYGNHLPWKDITKP